MKQLILLMPFLGIIFYSCIHDERVPNPDQGEQASILVTAGTSAGRITRGNGDPDDAIKEFRILVFRNGGTLEHNIHVPDITVSNPHKIEIFTGTYDFVFIANEDSDAGLSTTLGSLPATTTMADMETLSFSAAAFSRTANIPMAHTQRAVQVLGDNRLMIDGTEQTGDWEIELKRLAVRMDLVISTESAAKKDLFSKLRILNVPATVPVLETDASGNKIHNGGQANSQPAIEYSATLGDDGGFVTSGDIHKWALSRVILPSSVFTPDQEQDAMTLECVYTGGETSAVAMETGVPEGDYQVPRNSYIKADMTITPNFEVYLGVEDWDEMLIDATVGINRTLNVSAFSTRINIASRARIWFSSNMPEVIIDDYTSTDNYYLVNSIFKDLAGSGAPNLHYTYDEDTGTGSGYIDVMTADMPPSTGTYKLYLNANGLRREISVNVAAGGASSSGRIGYFEYVGVFWKNNEIGERVIVGKSTGAWSAWIEYGSEWFVLGPGRSADEKIYTEDHGDAEDYPVEGNDDFVSGTGEVYFRIGAKSKNTGAPRYGRIVITTMDGKNSSYIYLRQGEDPDYLMRPEDYGVDASGTYMVGNDPVIPRPLAGKFSPYNMTSEGLYNGTVSGGGALSNHSQVGYQAGKPVDYPTQAGAFFHWGQTSAPVYAYHPVNPTGSITSFGGTVASTYWNNVPSQDVCPPGYVRPRSGQTTGHINGSYLNSEMYQSLWINPKGVVATSTTANALFGYYADGYFDRKRIESPETGLSLNEHCAVRPGRPSVAYAGLLFYNPNTDSNASLFFPVLGFRYHGSGTTLGQLRYSGKEANYWTSASNTNSAGYAMRIVSPGIDNVTQNISRNGTTLYVNNGAQKNAGYNIRCVVENP